MQQLKKFLLMLIDIFIINASLALAFLIRFDGIIPRMYLDKYGSLFITITLIKFPIFFIMGLYDRVWRYASINSLMQVVQSVIYSSVTFIFIMYLSKIRIHRGVIVMDLLLTLFILGFSRLLIRLVREFQLKYQCLLQKKRILIVGAGDTGAIISQEMIKRSTLAYDPIGFIDDDPGKLGMNIHGIEILGNRYEIAKIVKEKKIDEILIAIPSASGKTIRAIILECQKTNVKFKTLPSLIELIDDSVYINQIRDVKVEDLLGRETVKLDISEISSKIKNKIILVTGAGGSIGSELCRQILSFEPKKMLLLGRGENSIYTITNSLRENYTKTQFTPIICDIKDKTKIEHIMMHYKPHLVYHAAAHKHVPLMEYFPDEAIKVNTMGTYNLVTSAVKAKVNTFVLISTDKAVNPTNIMGASKRMAEMLMQAEAKKTKNTILCAVRFGNVLGSRGSVIPLFKKQIEKGGPITLTHPQVTRYFMTIPEASRLVIQASSMAKSGELFILDMGEPVKIYDLARDLIRLAGLQPETDIEIKCIGLRPGEKLYEELMTSTEGATATSHKKIFVAQPLEINEEKLYSKIKLLKNLAENLEIDNIIKTTQTLIPNYQPNRDFNKKENKK